MFAVICVQAQHMGSQEGLFHCGAQCPTCGEICTLAFRDDMSEVLDQRIACACFCGLIIALPMVYFQYVPCSQKPVKEQRFVLPIAA